MGDSDDATASVLARLLPFRASEVPAYELRDFWDSPSTVEWFRSKGYTLYRRVLYKEGADASVWSDPALPLDVDGTGAGGCAFPYAWYSASADENEGGGLSLRAMETTGKLAYAQDSARRHVAVKIVPEGSEEHRIMQFLREQNVDVLRAHCVLPVLELLHFKGACFAVMPRWGTDIDRPPCHTMSDILCIMQSMLKGLVFLHSHNIIHRDIKIGNVLVNHFDDEREHSNAHPTRRALLTAGQLSYAIIDYDISIMLPAETKKGECRLPYQESFKGSPYHPSDTMQGEFDYDPFAYDVGTMGVVFCESYQRYTRQIPLLAPLLDRMITRDLGKRFTAVEALAFLEKTVIPQLTEEQLRAREYEPGPGDYSVDDDYEIYDRWKGLPLDFQERWAAYREPGIPFTWKILRSILDIKLLPPDTVPYIRWFFSKLSTFLRLAWK